MPDLTKLIALAEAVRDSFNCVDEEFEGSREDHAYDQENPDGTVGCWHCMAADALESVEKDPT